MKNVLVSLVLLLVAVPVWAEMEIITLKHRSAEELLPIIRPLLDGDAAASGMNNQLILRTSPQHLGEIKKLLENLDIAPRRLRITVMQDVDSDTVKRLTEVSGNIGIGKDARISAPGSGDAGGLNVELGRGQDKLRASVTSTHSLEGDRKTQQLQVLEGNRALVRGGQSVPLAQRQVIRRPWGVEVIDSTEYRQVDSGFYVLPRVNGDRVTLEISVRDDALVAGDAYPVTRTRQASSTISGRLGEWLAVGGAEQQNDLDDGTITTRGASHTQERRNVLIRVEEIR